MVEEEENNPKYSKGGLSTAGVVQIVFLILKLLKIKPVKNWEWWLVFSPTIITASIFCLCCFSICSISICSYYNKRRIEKEETTAITAGLAHLDDVP